MFFNHNNAEFSTERVSVKTANLVSDFNDLVIQKKFNKIKEISSLDGLNVSVLSIIKDCSYQNEEYEVAIDDKIVIKASTVQGAIYGLADIIDMIISNELYKGYIHEIPDTSYRGYRAFLPAREKISDFEKVLDFITDLKYNTLILEVGGAMEYKRHPKINETWFEFAKDVHRYSARSEEIQYSQPWSKNSIHVDNAGGEILTQDEVKKVVELAKSYGLNVAPEIPSLSHTDYLCQAYPEIAERSNDPYPDTYCPNNPKSYEILFDVQDEIIEVFKPKFVHIGHDEIYSLAICDKCKDADPIDLYVNDIVKIKNHLEEKGLKTMMWCDRLMEVYDKNGRPEGGSKNVVKCERGTWVKPELFPCAEKLPKDIILMDWLWGVDVNWRTSEKRLVDLGYKYVYGNLYCNITDWNERLNIGPFGGSISNWGSYEKIYMQRNLQNVSLTKIAYLLWNKNHKNEDTAALNDKVYERLFNDEFKSIPEENCLTILHTCNKEKRYIQFYDGYFIEEDDKLGKYVVEFADGSVKEYDVDYGYNIGNIDVEKDSNPCVQTIGKALPQSIDGKIWYKTIFDKEGCMEVKSIKFVPNDLNKDVTVEFKTL